MPYASPDCYVPGLGLSFDIASLEAPGATGSYDSHFASKAAVATDALINGGYDFALVHVKAVDDTGHDRMLAMKVWSLLGPLLQCSSHPQLHLQ
jgi:2,3-bisphosphoglycerate-independent phosphoglycerate mutase